MTTEKKTTQNRQPKTTMLDALFNSANNADIELSEKQLERSTGRVRILWEDLEGLSPHTAEQEIDH